MGKGESWDDSLLIKAFDDAISNYKKMHTSNNSVDGQQNHDSIRLTEAEVNKKIVSNTETEVREAENLAPLEGNLCMDSQALEACIDSLNNGLAMQDVPKGYSYSEGAEDYNRLLCQYYELEEKRQHILQQLQQFGSWNYQCSAEGYGSTPQWGACSAHQELPLPASQASLSAVSCSCCPCVCQTLVAPCTTYLANSLAGTCHGKTCMDTSTSIGSGKSFSPDKNNIIKTAMSAAAKAISCLKTTVNPDMTEEIEKMKEKEEEKVQNSSSETDLSVVLSAWYSAGFYTGKYLTEQSVAKKQHD